MTRACLVLVLALLAACVAPPADTPESPSPDRAVPDDFSLSLSRSACFGTCPIYTVRVEASGAVHWSGEHFVAVTGEARDTVPPARVRALAAAVDAAGAWSWAPQYVHGAPTCGDYHTDGPGIRIAVASGARRASVEWDTGCQGAPRGIGELAARVDSLLGTSHWIGDR